MNTKLESNRSNETTASIAMIHHPDVVRPIKTTLRSFGVKKRDLEDGVAEVQTRTLEYLRGKALPTETELWVALCVAITRSWRLDEKKKAKTDKKYCEGLCEDPDDRIGIEPSPDGRETVDARRMLHELQKQFDAGEMPEKGDEILDCVQAGMKYPEIAVELGITAHTVRMRLRRMRELFEARLVKLGITAMLFVLVVLATAPAMAANSTGPTAPPSRVPVPPPQVRSAA
jgi:DNA-directed RNA polymerase specialized sigma24 family protein